MRERKHELHEPMKTMETVKRANEMVSITKSSGVSLDVPVASTEVVSIGEETGVIGE